MATMSRISPLSGFPEWLPNQRIVESHIVSTLRRVFELHGYAEIETRAVEPLEHLLAKGETSKEVYLLRRLQEDSQAPESDTLGLHFDLTVPFARYVIENAGKLHFPFKRYQIQKVWRGERPQDGRFREFLQADIDVVADGALPFHYEVEMPIVIATAFEELRAIGMPSVKISVNNRKVSQGFYQGIGLEDIEGTLRTIDKLDKVGRDGVRALLINENGASEGQAEAALALAEISGEDARIADDVRALGVSHPLLDEGLEELVRLVEAAAQRVPGVVRADLKIARGLDYYTGSVYETTLVGHEGLGSICSGGRYDSLASDGKKTYPGVGISVGVTRLVSRLLHENLVTATRSTPTAVLVAVWDEQERMESENIAAGLRARGIAADVSPSAAKLGRQIRFADRRGIPFVWFPGRDGTGDEVKDIRSGEQTPAEASDWNPPAEDLTPRVVAAE